MTEPKKNLLEPLAAYLTRSYNFKSKVDRNLAMTMGAEIAEGVRKRCAQAVCNGCKEGLVRRSGAHQAADGHWFPCKADAFLKENTIAS